MEQKTIHCIRCNHDQKCEPNISYGDQYTCKRCGLDGELDMSRDSNTYILK